ncbi:MAG: N-acetyltransferase [Alphaproteobacteria bacterium]|nr:MAG: N-acetyltransferase [Alphaproteobacteria bacterium]
MVDVFIRTENKEDFFEVENLTREAFWNLYFPGCDEHYLVSILRTHRDFIPELDFVAIHNDRIVGNIMYTKSYIETNDNRRINSITFGPISVLPEFQRQGIGSYLISYSKKIALKMGFKAIIILGDPANYCKHGFQSSRDFNITNSSGEYPLGQLVLELEKDFLKGITGKYIYSNVYNIDQNEVDNFDKKFPPKQKGHKYSQEIFKILVRAYIK